jgi:hypothetical protein
MMPTKPTTHVHSSMFTHHCLHQQTTDPKSQFQTCVYGEKDSGSVLLCTTFLSFNCIHASMSAGKTGAKRSIVGTRVGGPSETGHIIRGSIMAARIWMNWVSTIAIPPGQPIPDMWSGLKQGVLSSKEMSSNPFRERGCPQTPGRKFNTQWTACGTVVYHRVSDWWSLISSCLMTALNNEYVICLHHWSGARNAQRQFDNFVTK